MLTKNRKRGRKRLKPENYRGHRNIERRFKKLFLTDNSDLIVVDDYPENLIECLERAVQAGKLIRLEKGVWWCCMKKDDDDETRLFCVMYQMAYGKSKPLTYLLSLVWDIFPESQYEMRLQSVDDPERCPEILAVLPSNMRRTFQKHPKNARIIPHVDMYVLTRKDTSPPGS